jgi:hypothetical protein
VADRSARRPGLIDTGANRSSITPELLGFLGLQEDGGHRWVKGPSDPECRQEPTYAVKMVFGGAFETGNSVTADLVPPQGQKYKALLGCDVLAACRLTYEGPHSRFPAGTPAGTHCMSLTSAPDASNRGPTQPSGCRCRRRRGSARKRRTEPLLRLSVRSIVEEDTDR